MRIVNPSYEFFPEAPFEREDAVRMMKLIEKAGRVCYKSEPMINDTSYSTFVSKLVKVKKHASIIEHCSVTVKVVIDRGVSHEWVRHRLAAYSQESTRYCNYSKDCFDNQITVVKPCYYAEDTAEYTIWEQACEEAEKHYFELLTLSKPEHARSVLPNSLKTELVATHNLREWKHIFSLRAEGAAHPSIREVMKPLQQHFIAVMPEVFGE